MRGVVIFSLLCGVVATADVASADDGAQQKPSAVTVSSTSSDGRWQATFNEDTRFFSWRSTQGFPNTVTIPVLPATAPASGSQLYVPVGLQLVGRPNDDFKVELTTRSGYIWSRQYTPGASGEVSTPTDTSFTGKVTYYGFAGWQPFAALSVNAPTGKTVLLGNSAFARMDPDIVDTPTFGEGWNIGPSVGVNIPLANTLLLSLGVGYTYRGPYNREGAIDPVTQAQGTTRIDPGDQITPTMTIVYSDGKLTLLGSASYVMETVTRLDGAPFYRTGANLLVNFGASYNWTNSLSTTLTGLFSHTARNKVAILGVPDLVTEAFDSNSNLYKGVLDITYKMGDLSIGPTGSYLYRDRNGWSSTDFQFLPAKTKWTAGVVAGYAVNKQVSFNARAEHFWILESDNPGKLAMDTFIPGSAVPVISTSAWLFTLGGLVTF